MHPRSPVDLVNSWPARVAFETPGGSVAACRLSSSRSCPLRARRRFITMNSVTLTQITTAAKRLLHVYDASAVVRRDCSGRRVTLSIRRNRGDAWEALVTQPTRAHLLAWVSQHDPAPIRSVEAGRSIAKSVRP
jgi:hypothetical protein